MSPEGSGRHTTRNATAGGLLGVAMLMVLSLAACGNASPGECATSTRVDLALIHANDAALPFRAPLDVVDEHPRDADFCEYRTGSDAMFHAAEDYWRPAGTAVYAIADGEVSFSGTMGGYGWLVIIDHPGMNLYSLYGHLSPSRWQTTPGPVAKGDLIGYLGDEWENGGSRDRPLVAHLHLGLRTGQRSDYAAKGEWRWMAGWIHACPADLGWLQPSAVIAAQRLPDGGFDGPAGGLLERWWVELLIVAAPSLGGAWLVVTGIRRGSPRLLLALAVVLGAAAWFLAFRSFSLVLPVAMLALASLLATIAILVGRRRQRTAGKVAHGR